MAQVQEKRRRNGFPLSRLFDAKLGTISKTLKLLNYFSESAPELGLVQIRNLSGHDKATVHRYLVELHKNGFLEQNPESRKHRLGSALLRLAAVRERTFPARRIVAGRVRELSRDCGELVHAAIIQPDGMSPIQFFDAGVGGTRVYFDEADVLPLHATASGLAALAFGEAGLMENVLKRQFKQFTSDTLVERAELTKTIEECRLKGYAFSIGTFEAEVCSFAVPFFEDGEFAYGTLAIAMPSSRLSQFSHMQLVKKLWKYSETISRELGGRVPGHVSELWTATE